MCVSSSEEWASYSKRIKCFSALATDKTRQRWTVGCSENIELFPMLRGLITSEINLWPFPNFLALLKVAKVKWKSSSTECCKSPLMIWSEAEPVDVLEPKVKSPLHTNASAPLKDIAAMLDCLCVHLVRLEKVPDLHSLWLQAQTHYPKTLQTWPS